MRCLLAGKVEAIQVAAEALRKVMVQALGRPGRTVADGVAAGLAAVAVGIGDGACKGGESVAGFLAFKYVAPVGMSGWKQNKALKVSIFKPLFCLTPGRAREHQARWLTDSQRSGSR